jgi:hypothetical protein
LFQHPDFDYEARIVLGAAWTGMAADLAARGDEALRRGHLRTASWAHLAAAEYYAKGAGLRGRAGRSVGAAARLPRAPRVLGEGRGRVPGALRPSAGPVQGHHAAGLPAPPGRQRSGPAAFAAALAARPAGEEPLFAARHALQSSILDLHGSAGSLTAYLAAMRLIDSTPTLLAAYLRSVHDHDDEIIEVLARREGVDPVADRRPPGAGRRDRGPGISGQQGLAGLRHGKPGGPGRRLRRLRRAVIPALASHWT